MSQDILIRDLRQKSSDRISEMWREAEGKAESLRIEQEEAFALLKEEDDVRLQEIERSVAAPIIFSAEKKALLVVDEALRKLSERLYALAHNMLPYVRQNEYEKFFAGLVEELPPFEWETVTVNVLDEELAQSYFPGAEIIINSSLSGGFITSGDNDRYRVINTLERRLEKAWPFIIPALLKELVGEKDAAPAA
ncbi:MAG: hypothetical protein OEM01_06145 [Desulfobulbaceae bacterium]|nr:hypothetical protein [Desulfobulbaceae bacterium]